MSTEGQIDSLVGRRGRGLRDLCETKAGGVVMEKQFEARRAFGDLLAMYDLRSADGRDLVAAATELLVADIDGPAVIELASEVVTPLTSPFEIDALVSSARDELGMPALDPKGTGGRAASGQLRRWRSGLLTDREIAHWAHKAIGHDGNAPLQDLVVLDDMFDELEWIDATPESIHAELEAIATAYLASPDPWAAE
jgi:hypothetical protein